ncbi:hypothetical protein SAMN05661010_01005 [Modicisalibacter muralis]|uniref:Lipopolysaccharide assembly protein A domain-containing protein n=1 Tax=Modicisalibacter muralis TaxID=119000 RepID=A0A1G9I1G6_9GAMM|nr:hypothetical protein [Halomonas muralis]SDL18922.1 hypothetical protein SAMN05661010_01005 [Halomonas muralis]
MKLITRGSSVLFLLFLVASPAMAYIGPGAGLSLLGALWGLVAAVGAALLFVLLWPFRRMLRRKREAKEANAIPKQEAQQKAQQKTQPDQQKSETTHDTVAQKSTEHSTSADPNASTAQDSAVHDDEKKPTDVGTR